MVSKRIKELREEKGISQRKMAEIFNMSQQAIAKWETAKAEPDIEMLKNLSIFFNVNINYLIGINNDRTPLTEEKKPPTSKEALQILADEKKLSKKDIEYLKDTIKLIEAKNKIEENNNEFGQDFIPRLN